MFQPFEMLFRYLLSELWWAGRKKKTYCWWEKWPPKAFSNSKLEAKKEAIYGKQFASNLNGNKDLFSYVSSRGCRDRFTLISRRYKAKTAEELKSTGGGSEDEPSEYDLLLEELTHLSEESDKRADTEAETAKKKSQWTKGIGSRSKNESYGNNGSDLETIRVWWVRGRDNGKKKTKIWRGHPAMAEKKKADRDLKFKELQLEEQRKEREFQQKERKEQMELLQKQIQAESQQQHQQQQMMLMQQMMSMMQQQQ